MSNTKPYVLAMPDGSEWRTVCSLRSSVLFADGGRYVRRYDRDDDSWQTVLAVWDDQAQAFRGRP